MVGFDLVELRLDGGGIELVGGFAGEAKEDSAVSAVADAGEGEGAVEMGGDPGGLGDAAGVFEIVGEAEGGAHGADGVGARRADADLEEFEEAGVHSFILRV